MNSVWGKEGGKVKKIWMMTAALGLGIWLTGCSSAFVPVEDPSEPQTEERNSPETEKEDQRENLAANDIPEEKFGVIQGNIIDDKATQDAAGYEKYDVVTANILADVIMPLSKEIAQHFH